MTFGGEGAGEGRGGGGGGEVKEKEQEEVKSWRRSVVHHEGKPQRNFCS